MTATAFPMVGSKTLAPGYTRLPYTGGAISDQAFVDMGLSIRASSWAFDRVTFAGPGGIGRLLGIGDDGKTAAALVTDAKFNGAGMSRGNASIVTVGPQSVAVFRRASFINSPRIHLDSSADFLLLDESKFGCIGQAGIVADHLEAVFIRAGRVLIRNTVVDISPPAGKPQVGGVTSPVFFKSQVPGKPLDAEVLGGTFGGGGAYTFQVGADKAEVTVRIGGAGLHKGLSGYAAANSINFRARIIDLGGNYDAVTGAAINLTQEGS